MSQCISGQSVSRGVAGCSLGLGRLDHDLHDLVVRDVVRVHEELILQLLAQAEETHLLRLHPRVRLARLCELLLQFLDGAVVHYFEGVIGLSGLSEFDLNTTQSRRLNGCSYLDSFLIRELFVLHFLKQLVFVVVLRIVDAGDGDAVVDPLAVHDPSQGLLWQVQFTGFDQRQGCLVVLSARVLKQGPDLLYAVSARFYKAF